MNTENRVSPQAPEIEEAIIGACLIEQGAIPLVADKLRPEMFYVLRHQVIYAAILAMYHAGIKIDILTVKEELSHRRKFEEAGGPFGITQLSSKVATSAHIEYHAQIVHEKYLRREMILGFNKLLACSLDETMDIDDSLVDAHNLLDRLEGEFGHNNHMRDMDELMTATMVEAARIVEQAHPDTLDINFGCPVKRVAGKGAGAGMLQNIPLMLEITRAVVDAVKIPVTVKTRLGWDANSKIIVDLAEQLQDCGIAALTIHGRTRAQMYTGEADWTLIGEVKKNPRMHIPIIGNGDITTPQRAKECFDLYGVDAIMIGRASFGRPWFFKEVKHYLETGEELPPLSSEWRLNVLRQEVEDSVNLLDERRGILHVRRHLAASPLFKGIPNFRDTRIAMLRAETKEELYRIFEEIEPLLP